jgi:DNA recombination protein RmuC
MIFAGIAIGLLIGVLATYAFLTRRSSDLAAQVGSLESLLSSQEENHQRQMELVQADREALSEQMRAISSDVLKQTSKELKEQMTELRKVEGELSKAELEKRTTEIKMTVGPVSEGLKKVQERFEALERQRAQAQGRLDEQLRQLSERTDLLAQEAGDLTAALSKPAERGNWGEIHLERVVEMAGLSRHSDFVTQDTRETDDGRQRPDLVVKMPGGKVVVIDSKAPGDSFHEALSVDSDAEREALLKRHAQQMRNHVTELNKRDYQSNYEETVELVVMFVPSEGIYQAALSADPDLYEFALTKKVVVATPTTLIGFLKAVNLGWRQEKMAQSAKAIAQTGEELHARIIKFLEHIGGVGQAINRTVTNFNGAVRSYDSRVAPSLRRLEELGIETSKEIPDLETVEETTATFDSEPGLELPAGEGSAVVEDDEAA